MTPSRCARWLPLLIPLTLFTPLAAWAQASGGMPALTSTPGAGGSQTYAVTIETLITLTALAFIPAMLLMMTSFTRLIIVLSILRHALGTQTSPPNQVMLGLALFLTFFIMSPILEQIHTDAYVPLSENRITFVEAVERGVVPLRGVMLKQTRQSDIGLFARLGNIPEVGSPEELPMRVLIPSFVTSELKTAFQIGFVIYIPFLIIDMVVASILMSMGMMMMSPVMVSLPFTLMLFVLVDGWHLMLGSLVMSF
ncbi:MAG: flagellar type III secretion system pore protein FliP, partial [Candidatus Accumulibacter sp.]|nr:flagellar type III secretion system pore protein FliP [Accumulibacter sp.]